jgi:membrane fusion protein, multidrug efflux system
MRKKIILWTVLLLFLSLLAWKLNSNKNAINAKAELSKSGRTYIPVETVAVGTDMLSNRLEADGIFLPAKEMLIISETAGRVLEIFKNKGESLREGEPIAKVDDEMLRIELEATQANIAKLRKDRERLTNLIEGDAAPKNKMEDLELGILAAEAKEKGLKKQISNTTIKAPMTGTLGFRFIERGTVIGPGIQVGQMTNLDKLFLMVKVTERDVLNVKKGMIVDVQPDVLTATHLSGKVTNIGLRSDNSFTYDVEIEVVNPIGNPLRGGMHSKAVFSFQQNRNGMVLPRKAITGSLQDAQVYVVKDSIATIRAIKLGVVQSDKVEIVSGLQSGEQVVISGQMNLTDGVKVAPLNPQK